MPRTDYQADYYQMNRESIEQKRKARRERIRAERELNKSRLTLDQWLKRQFEMSQLSQQSAIEVLNDSIRYGFTEREIRDHHQQAMIIGCIKSMSYAELKQNAVEFIKFLDYLFMNKFGNSNVEADIKAYFSNNK